MEYNPQLQEKETKIIRRVAKLQLSALDDLLQRRTQENIEIYCALRKIPIGDFDKAVKRQRKIFIALKKNPASFLNLEEVNILIIKHIMESFITQKSLQNYKAGIWRKFNTRERISNITNSN